MFSPGDVRVWIGSDTTAADVTEAFGDLRVTIGATTVSLPTLGTTEATIVTLGSDVRVSAGQAYYGQGLDLSTATAIAVFDVENDMGIAMSALPQAREQWGMPATASQVAVLQVTPEFTVNGLMTYVYGVSAPSSGHTVSVTPTAVGDRIWTVSKGSNATKVAAGNPVTGTSAVSVTTNNYALLSSPYP